MTASRLPVETLGVILAGGLSRRMEGPEKSLLTLSGKPMIAHCVERLQKQTGEIVVNANGDPERFSSLGLPVQSDTVEGFAGPLAGVLAGMEWARNHSQKTTHIMTAAADTPFFPEDLLHRLVSLLPDTKPGQWDQTIIIAASNGRRHPVFGLWPVALAQELRHFLVDEGERKVMLFASRYQQADCDFANISVDGGEIDPFFNVNTPSDLDEAETIMQSLHRDESSNHA